MTIEEQYVCKCRTEVFAETEIWGRSVKSTVYHLGEKLYEKDGVTLVSVQNVECDNRGDEWGTVCAVEGCPETTPGIVHGWCCANHQTTEPLRAPCVGKVPEL
jgi:hypothetical protein